ncbi:MAG: hypothetical protein K2X82_07240 [Gemmataceae bacterium]|nr:hypothetical protein [Gemmataceae bacterium]
MNPFGGTLTRFLTLVTAFLTVTAGVPHVRCVCPDGRVRFFCPGPVASGCCCTDPSARTDGGTGLGCCRAVAGSGAGSTKSVYGASDTSAPDGHTPAVKACGCERSAAEPLPPAAAEADDWSGAEAAWAVATGMVDLPAAACSHAILVERRLLLPPPDLVLIHCHFTC